MKDTFGIHRVLEPRGAVPVTAWKVDNKKDLSFGEARVALSRIHVDKSSFSQVANQCGYDESKMIQRFKDIISKRGKLHNPFTNTGGMFYGRIEEMDKHFQEVRQLNKGDEFLCLVTMTAIPMYIEDIEEIDFNYGQLKVKGYAIVFEDTLSYNNHVKQDIRYTLSALDEAGTVYRIADKSAGMKHVGIIARDIISAVLYSGAIRQANHGSTNISVIMDYDCCGGMPEEKVKDIILESADRVYFTDLRNSIESFDGAKPPLEEMDLVVNCEDKLGSETLSVFLCKNDGTIYFTSLDNGCSDAILIAESMRKHVYALTLDQYFEGYNDFTANLLNHLKNQLEEVNELYNSYAASKGVSERTAGILDHYRKNQTEGFIYASPVTGEMLKETINIAKYDCNVIIQGETGVGKEKVLELLQKNSERNDKACIKVNCATIQENLAEAEFFGYEEGSFTGAKAGGKKGYFELANNGILFLDEIGTLSMNMQSKLLRVLQENQFYRVGGTKQLTVNVRVICANNINLMKLVEEGRFREDLYYRLNICQINIPPLRARKEDIYVLAKEFLSRYNKKYSIQKEITLEGYKALEEYSWPGNVRELENAIHRMVINSEDNIIDYSDVKKMVGKAAENGVILSLAPKKNMTFNFDEIMDEQGKRLVANALKTEKTTRKAALALGITQAKLMRLKKRYNL